MSFSYGIMGYIEGSVITAVIFLNIIIGSVLLPKVFWLCSHGVGSSKTTALKKQCIH